MLFYLLLAFIKRKDSAEEIELMKKISTKNQGALSELYDLYSKLLYSIIFKIVKKQEDTEEILQSIFLQVWEKAVTFDYNNGNVLAWLITIARNKAIDKIRSGRYKKDKEYFNFFDDVKLDQKFTFADVDALIAKERTQMISKALNVLPEEQKKVIEMAYYEGYTQAEISEKLNVPLGTVKTRTRQALGKLENLLSSILE